ncbi:unnamed protein product [Effrenium voratum]|uniref:C3H1-type domain-containing protein n=1 Tax=Effrenium voratum TaxID=2562239 RepID=A0AA36ISR9_9DINO|nr:unnamed protein product [Effrenium voratum]|mmetsp:Transcript_1738/g.4025  ORF Transcript_1738/g.4025 Transcript_1738/m.4025 type:complete len:139 (-) Transcript_1738:97-513(-)
MASGDATEKLFEREENDGARDAQSTASAVSRGERQETTCTAGSGTFSASSSDFPFEGVPGLDSSSSSSQESRAFNTKAAHEQGTCRACRFFQLHTDGCRLGAACKFCHFCSKEEAKAVRLHYKYEDRRSKRRHGLRKR